MYKNRATLGFLRWTAIALVVQGCNVNGQSPKATIENASVTGDKMAPNAIASGNIQDGAVTTGKIADGAVTAAKLDPNINFTVNGGNFASNVTVGGTLTSTGNFTASANATVLGTLTVGTVATPKTSTFNGQASIANTLAVAGITSSLLNTVSSADVAVGSVYASNIAFTLNPAADTSTTFYGHNTTMNFTPSFNAANPLIGSFIKVNDAAGGAGNTMATATGSTAIAENSGAGTITQAIGVAGESWQQSAGSIVTGYGVSGQVALSATGAMTNGIAVDGWINNTGTGTITNGYALNTRLVNSGGGAVTNYHALHMSDPGGGFVATRYNLYSAGNTYNYIAGRLGIANLAPAYELDITGQLNTTSNIRIGGNVMCDVTGCNPIGTYSDRRLKENVVPLKGSLEKVLALEPVSYDFKDQKKYSSGHQIGFIAQDVEKLFPEVVKTDKNSGYKRMAYWFLVAPLVEAFQSLYKSWHEDHLALQQNQVKLGQLERKIELENVALKAENKLLRDRLEKIEQALAAAPVKAPAKKGRKLASMEE